MPTSDIRHGDALTILPTLPTDSVDAVITDPPYSSGPGLARLQSARKKYVSSNAMHELADFAGDQKDQRSFTYWLATILSECHRIARPGASALVFTDWRQLPATSDALQAAGWVWRGVIPWHKTIARPTRNGFKSACEYILWGSNGEPHRHTPTLYLPGLYSAAQPRGAKRFHITQKPDDVMNDLVRICPEGGAILDPFAGSGSTGAAALASGRSFIGIEITDHYARIAEDRTNRSTHVGHDHTHASTHRGAST